MPHLRERHIFRLFKKYIAHSPLVGILGHRQVGKTTFLEQYCKSYVSMDSREALWAAQNNPEEFLLQKREKPCALDEVQLCPDLFPALKEHVRKSKIPGAYVLSGSVRFTSKKLIKESLTGRILNIELLPLTLSEIAGLTLPTHLPLLEKTPVEELFANVKSPVSQTFFENAFDKYIDRGGLPGVFGTRDKLIRISKINGQIDSILDRDLKEIVKTELPYRDIRSLLQELARSEGEQINLSELRRQSGSAPQTIKKLIHGFESVFLIRSIPIEGDSVGESVFFEDQLEWQILKQKEASPLKLWTGVLYRNLREQLFYREGIHFSFFQYKRRGGAFLPICIHLNEANIGILPTLDTASRSDLASARSFLSRYNNSQVLLVSKDCETKVIDKRIMQVPARALLF